MTMMDRKNLVDRLRALADEFEAAAEADDGADEDLEVARTLREAIGEILRHDGSETERHLTGAAFNTRRDNKQ